MRVLGKTELVLIGRVLIAFGMLPLLSIGARAEERVIEEIVVTATKRAASIQDIPASVSQLGGSELGQRGVVDIESLAFQVPSLQFGKLGDTTFVTIRGIGSTVDSGVAEPAVASYVDGVFLPRPTMSSLRQVDLERVEVLRGPQGTLYGRNATGGSINFVSRAPADEFEAGVLLSARNRDGYGASAYVSGPLSETVAYRVSLGRESQDGYVNVINTGQDIVETDSVFGRAALRISPSDALDIDLSLQHEKSDGAMFVQQLLSRAGVVDFVIPGNNQTVRPNKVFGDGEFSGDGNTTIFSARVNWDISDTMSFRSVTGYVDHDIVAFFDADGTDAHFVDAVDYERTSESISQELNLYGDAGPLSWLVGAYFFDEEFELVLPVDFIGVGLVTAGDLAEETTSYAAFVDITYSLTDRLRLNAGLRYNAEEKEFLFFGVPDASLGVPDTKIDRDDVLPKLGLQFDVNDNMNVYAHWQKGIKSGGHQLTSPTLFESEELNAYEVGLKSQFMDRRLTVNASAFFYDYQNLQATTTIPPTTTLVQNADAEVTGFELELFYTPTAALSFNLGLSFLDSEYQDFTFFDQSSQLDVDLDGEELIRSPGYTLNLGVDWTVPVGGDLLKDVVVRGEIYSTDDYKSAFVDYPETRQDSYTTGNLSVTLTSASETFQLRAYVDNIADELALNNGSYLATVGAFIGQYNEPRNYGLELGLKF